MAHVSVIGSFCELKIGDVPRGKYVSVPYVGSILGKYQDIGDSQWESIGET
jgi:hypothetical protein